MRLCLQYVPLSQMSVSWIKRPLLVNNFLTKEKHLNISGFKLIAKNKQSAPYGTPTINRKKNRRLQRRNLNSRGKAKTRVYPSIPGRTRQDQSPTNALPATVGLTFLTWDKAATVRKCSHQRTIPGTDQSLYLC